MLTKRQKEVLDFIKIYSSKFEYAPSLEDIRRNFKLASVSTAHFHVSRLQDSGYLMRVANKPRSISVPADKSSITTPPTDIIKTVKRSSSFHRNPEKQQKLERSTNSLIDRIIEGDCLDIMKTIPSKSIDMILCDLPYGTTQNKWDCVIPLHLLWREYNRVIKDNGAVALTGQGIFTAKLILSNPSNFKYKIVWVKSKATNFLNAKKQPLRRHEDVLIFYKKQPKYTPQMTKGIPYNKGFRKNQLTGSYGDFGTVEVKSDGDRYPTDVVYFKTPESEGAVYHPTQKPVELGRYLIRTFTQPGEIVLDNTCGSGSFLVSAVLENRKFIGIEKNKEVFQFKKKKVDYIEICEQRIKKAREQYIIENSQPSLL